MSKSRNWANPRQIVRPRSYGRVPVLLCLLLAGLCSLAVYRWGYEHWWPSRSKPTYTATAYVVEPDSTAPRVPFTNTDADPQRASDAADAMAELYIADCRKDWRERMEPQLALARREADQARAKYERTVAEIEEFKQERQEVAVEEKTAVAEATREKTITNPQWLKLEQESLELIKERNELLVTRTSQHPSVMAVSDKIVEIERRMAAIPRNIPFSDKAAERDVSMSAAVEKTDWDAGRRLNALAAAAANAEETLRESERAVSDAKRRIDSPPRYSVEYAGIEETPPAFDFGWRRLMWTTLISGLIMAFGAGTFSFGAGIEPPVGSANDVRKATGKSVVGTIPSEDATADQAEIRRQTKLQRTAIAVGLVLIVVCPAVAVWGVLGI